MNHETTTPELHTLLENIFAELVKRKENIIISFAIKTETKNEFVLKQFNHGGPQFAKRTVINVLENLNI